ARNLLFNLGNGLSRQDDLHALLAGRFFEGEPMIRRRQNVALVTMYLVRSVLNFHCWKERDVFATRTLRNDVQVTLIIRLDAHANVVAGVKDTVDVHLAPFLSKSLENGVPQT